MLTIDQGQIISFLGFGLYVFMFCLLIYLIKFQLLMFEKYPNIKMTTTFFALFVWEIMAAVTNVHFAP